MAYEISWFQDGHIVYQYFYGNVSNEELQKTSQIVAEYVKHGTGMSPVHVITEVSEVENYPLVMNGINQAVTKIGNPQLGWMTVINKNTFRRILGNAFSPLSGGRVRIFSDMDDAFEFLVAQDAVLKDLLPVRELSNQHA